MAVGAILSAAGSITKGVAGFKAAQYNARVAKQNARLTEADGAQEQAAIAREARAVEGAARAAQGGSGLQLGSGSALDLLSESALNAELNSMSAQRQAIIKAQGFRAEAKMQKQQGLMSLLGGGVGAGAALYGGFGKGKGG